jgi:hypothetical protein
MGKHGKAVELGYYYQPFHGTKASIFSVRPHTRDLNRPNYTTVWELLTDYCKRRFCTRQQVKRFAAKKWIAVSSFRNRLYVCELCPDEIDDWLSS